MAMSALVRGVAAAASLDASASPPSASRDRAAAPARIARHPLSKRGSTVPPRARARPAAFAPRKDGRDATLRPRLRAKPTAATAGTGVGASADDDVSGTSPAHPAASSESDASTAQTHATMFVEFFRQASPYIANHRGATFVVVVPGSVMTDPDRSILEGIVQDIAMLNSLGVRVAVVIGSNEQVSAMCDARGVPVEVVDGYRVTTPESLEIAMEAAGRNNVLVQALLSRGVNVAVTRRHGDRGDHVEFLPFGERSGRGGQDDANGGGSIDTLSRAFGNARPGGGATATSGNFITAKRRGIVRGVDFQYTGDVAYVDVDAVAQRLRQGDVVLLSSLGFNAAGEVLNCQSYDVAVSLAVDIAADKLISYVAAQDMPRGEDGVRAKYMPLSVAETYISRLAKAAKGGSTRPALRGDERSKTEDASRSPPMPEQWRWLDREGDDEVRGALAEDGAETGRASRGNAAGAGAGAGAGPAASTWRRLAERGLQWRVDGCPQEISAAVFSCKAGVRRAHLIEYTVPGALLLELYTLDGVGAMVSRDRYEGTRGARLEDWTHIKSILAPLAKQGVTVAFADDELIEEVTSGAFAVTERDGKIIACAALRRYRVEREGGSGGSRDGDDATETNRDERVFETVGEIAAFAVRPGYRNEGRGDQLLEYLEREAARENIHRLFLLTTRTADWFTARGFTHAGAAERSPLLPPGKKTLPGRNSQLYVKGTLR